MKKLLLGILALSLFAVPGNAQEVSDTILITITGRVTDVVLSAEYVTPFRVGDSALFLAEVTDEDGDPINALISFFSEDSTALRIEPVIENGGAASNVGMAVGIALRKASVRVWVMVEPIGEMRLASFRDGELNWSGYDTLRLYRDASGNVIEDDPRHLIQYCAYLTRGTTLVAESPGPPTCPTVFLPDPSPSALPFVLARRSVTRAELGRLGRGLPVNPHTDSSGEEVAIPERSVRDPWDL